MTAKCHGAASRAISGAVTPLVYTTGAVGILSLVPGLEWLLAVGSVLGVLTYELTDVCSTDPPATPTFTAAEVLAFVTSAIGSSDWISFVNKVHDLLANIVWLHWCECVDASAPIIPTWPVTPPVGIAPTFSGTGLRVTTTRANARAARAPSGTITDPVYDDSAWLAVGIEPGSLLGGVVAYLFHNSATDASGVSYTLPSDLNLIGDQLTGASGSGNQNVRWAFDLPLVPSGVPSYGLVFPSGTGVTSSSMAINGHTTAFATNPLNWNSVFPYLQPGRNVIEISITANWSANPRSLGMFIEWPGSGSSVIPSDCCDKVQQLLVQLAGTVSVVNQLVTLIQRQDVPFAYVHSTVHSALTGAGELSVSGLIGVKVSPDSIPADATVAVGDPDTLWLDSWINWGNADGWSQREWLRTAPYISLPRASGQYTKLGYTIRPGMSVTITELVRES